MTRPRAKPAPNTLHVWDGVEAVYAPHEAEHMRTLRDEYPKGEARDLAWFIHTAKATFPGATLVDGTYPEEDDIA